MGRGNPNWKGGLDAQMLVRMSVAMRQGILEAARRRREPAGVVVREWIREGLDRR